VREQFLKGDRIGAVVEDDHVPMVDEEGTGCRKIAELGVRKRIIEELVLTLGRGVKRGDLEN
jgi:hypothetical protein